MEQVYLVRGAKYCESCTLSSDRTQCGDILFDYI